MTFVLRIFTKLAGREESAWTIEGDCDSLKSDDHEKPEPPKSIGCKFCPQILNTYII